MRKIRVSMVVVALVVTTSVPGLAQAQVEVPQWGGGTVAERLIGWIEGLWTVVAGAETDPVLPPDGSEGVGVTPDGPGIVAASDDPSTQGKLYPELDPNG